MNNNNFFLKKNTINDDLVCAILYIQSRLKLLSNSMVNFINTDNKSSEIRVTMLAAEGQLSHEI